MVVVDVLRPKKRQPFAARNPWSAGTLEWLQEMPGKPWGIRAIPTIKSRYPLWDQPNLMAEVDAGQGYLPDAEEERRETLIVSAIDARPLQIQRLPGSSFLPLLAAVTLGGFFVFGTFHWWKAALASTVASVGVIVAWLWSGTARIPEKDEKEARPGETLPLYVSGAASIGWMGMFIMMLADMTAYASLVFGYFFFWTVHDDFPPKYATGPGIVWPSVAAALLLGAWVLTVLARRWNARDCRVRFYGALVLAIALSAAGGGALILGPWRTGLDPTRHVYPAIVWVLVLWTVFHVAAGALMLMYCLLRRIAGRMTARYDIDIRNVTLYWHFTALTVVMTVLVIAGFPEVR